MRRHRRHHLSAGVVSAVALAFAALLAAAPAAATTYAPISDAALTDQAALVVDARVVSAEPAAAYGEVPGVDYRIEVDRVLKGGAAGSTLVVRVPGGLDPARGIGLKVYGAPTFGPGERTLLFLRPAEDGTYRILHLMLGAFHQRLERGRRVARRDFSEAKAVELPGRPAEEEPLRDFDAFSSWVEERAGGARATSGYVLGKATGQLEQSFEKFTFMTAADGQAIRWFDFDRGADVGFRVHDAGQPGLGVGATVAALQTAVAAWRDDPASNVRFHYAGTTSASGGLARSDGLNTILFDDPYRDDPREAVEGTFSCHEGGVIAMGGPWFYSGTRLHKGKRYHEAAEADIVTNDGTDCFFGGDQRVAEEVFAHELGHTLGLGHSGFRDALMYSRAHDDGRGALLHDDDRAAIAALYGDGSGGGGGAGPAKLVAPRRLTGVPVARTAVRLDWRDRAAGESGYVVEARRGRGRFVVVATLPADSTAASIAGLLPGTRYFFRVRAVEGARSSTYSNVVGVWTWR